MASRKREDESTGEREKEGVLAEILQGI